MEKTAIHEKQKIWEATDGRRFLDRELWASYERTLLKVPVSTFGEEEIRRLTEVVFGDCYDITGRPSQGMRFRYFVKHNSVLSGFNDNGISQEAFDVAVECYSSPGTFSELRAKLETVLLYSFSGVGEILVVPAGKASPAVVEIKQEWTGRIYPVAPVLRFRAMAALLEELGLNNIWQKEERPVNEMLFAEQWTLLFAYELD